MFSDDMIDEVVKDGSVLGYAIEIKMSAEEIVRAHTGVGSIVIDGDTYIGVGELGSVGILESVGDENPSRLDVGLSGLPGDTMQEVLRAQVRGAPAQLLMLAFSSETGQLIRAEAAIIGIVTDYNVISGDSNEIGVTIADEFELYEMPWHEYWTDESHSKSHESDRLCRYASQMEDREIAWGSQTDAPPFRYVE